MRTLLFVLACLLANVSVGQELTDEYLDYHTARDDLKGKQVFMVYCTMGNDVCAPCAKAWRTIIEPEFKAGTFFGKARLAKVNVLKDRGLFDALKKGRDEGHMVPQAIVYVRNKTNWDRTAFWGDNAVGAVHKAVEFVKLKSK